MEKINIDFLDGCSYSMLINGTEFVDLTPLQQRELCHRIIDSKEVLHSTLTYFLESYYECDAKTLPEEYDNHSEDIFDRVNIDAIHTKTREELKKECNACVDAKDCEEATLQGLVEKFAEGCGNLKDLGQCETCGSYNYNYIITI